jgi:hypothetical protein
VLSVAFSAAVLAQSSAAIRTQLFGATDALKKDADAVHASMLAPESYKEAMEFYGEAGDTLEKGKDLESVRQDLAKADPLFKKATEAAKLAQVTFKDTLEARAAAEKADAAKYAAKDWTKAEQALTAAAMQLESGNLNKATKSAHDVMADYKAVEGKAVNAKAKAAK